MTKQLGFLVDTTRCVGCNACRVACQVNNKTGPQINWREVNVVQKGVFPEVEQYTLSLSCNHCAEPACMSACPVGAIKKRKKDGLVYIDAALCNGCERCVPACPYGAPQKGGTDGKVTKCDGCMERVDQGREPHCVETCIGGALHFGPLEEMSKMAGGKTLHREIEGFADPKWTNPSTRFLKAES